MPITNSVDALWLTMATFLVLLMQAGFLLLEGGRVRSKNSINVAQKNVSDLVVAWFGFLCVGFFIMFGITPPMSTPGAGYAYGASPMHFIYQLGFCAAAGSIISGGTAERISFRAYLALILVVSTLIYPVAGRMVWGDTFNPGIAAPLASIGFIDFAGATVVHGVGAACALTAIIMIGPRLGRFSADGTPVPLSSSNPVLSMLGILILMVGWIGFNGGGLSISDPLLQMALMNTLTAAAFGGVAGMFIGAWLDEGKFNPERSCNGIVAGLVAVTACASFASPFQAVLVGFLGGLVGCWGADYVLNKFKLDDPVDVVATHGFAGATGTLCVSFVAPLSMLPSGSRLIQLAVQSIGVVSIWAFAGLITFATLKCLARFTAIRVSAEDEEIGLNYTEHGQAIGTDRLKRAINAKIQNHGSFNSRLDIASDDEDSELANAMNQLLDKHDQVHQQLELSKNRFQQFAHTASDWLFETDQSLTIKFLSENNKDAETGSVFQPTDFFDFFLISGQEKRIVSHAFSAREAITVMEAEAPTIGNQSSSPLVEIRAVPFFNESAEFCGYRGTVADVTVRKAAENQALFLSTHDELTGLPNRRALKSELERIFNHAENGDQAVVVAGIDLDGFKSVNDSYGHNAGDELLKEVTQRVRAVQRPQDLAFRTGGDEFVMVITGLSVEDAERVATTLSRRIISEVSREYLIAEKKVSIGASVGLAIYPRDSKGSSEITRLADLALYSAKAQGKGQVITFEPKMDRDAQRRLSLENDLRKALGNNEFYLMYQPLIDTGTEEILGFEALIRWKHPERGEISPADFIWVAEKIDVINEIGEYVLLEACRFATSWLSETKSTQPYISVNVSPTQLKSEGFTSVVNTILETTALDPARLVLEITEETIVDDFDQAHKVLLDLRDLGVGIAVDDFGSGQTSLRYLSQFPITKLKIDQNFIRQFDGNDRAQDITQSIITLGKKLGLLVTAEGVEKQRDLDKLRKWNCNEVQGFLFSKPVGPDVVIQMLDSSDQGKRSKSR